MAEKVIKTRLQLKYDTLENWTKVASTFTPKKGEVCFVEVADNADPIHNAPSILFKVGDGKSTFEALKWGSGLAADVYSWAKAANKPSYAASEVGVTESAFPGLKKTGTVTSIKINGSTKTDTNGLIDLGSFLTSHQDISGKQNKNISLEGFTAKTVEAALSEAKKAGTDAQATANTKYTKPSGGIPKSDLASTIQTSLGKADTALQAHQTIATGSTNGTIAVAGTDVAVKGLAALAYKASLGKGDVGLGNVENKTLDTSVKASSGNYITSGAVKSYVDGQISGLTKFDIVKYDEFSSLPTTGVKGTIYIVPHAHGTNDSYDEYIWNTALTTPAYEKIGNTDVDLSGYVPTSRKVNGKPLSTDISLGAADVGVNETAFPGLKKAGTVTSVSGADGLTGSVTSSGSLKANLNSYTKNTAAIGGKLYAVELDKSGKLAVNVPWTDTNTTYDIATATTAGLVKSSTTGTTSGRDYKVQVNTDGTMKVNVPWTDTNTQRTDAEIKAIINTYPGVNKTGTVTSVQIKGSTYVKVDNEAAITQSGTRTISLSDKVLTQDDVLVFDCGSSTVNI